ncbi:MAG: hypothetical protein JWO36_5790, partial [Myxococcales bacterium]|nr:hypothetical protein [Myxococcales bacterium]
MTMRTTIILATLALTAGHALAEDNIAGSYDVKFEEMASNCTPPTARWVAARSRSTSR